MSCREILFELLVLEVLCPLVGGFFLQENHFPGLPLVILIGVLRLLLAFRLGDVALPGGVAGVFTMKRAIQLVMLILAFITMLVLSFELEALFSSFLCHCPCLRHQTSPRRCCPWFLIVRSVPRRYLDLWSLD